MESILTSIKKLLGIAESYEQFDQDIIIHINTVFTILNQMGVGPKKVFSITDKHETWNKFTENFDEIQSVKTYVYLRTRMIFDPPTSSLVSEAINRNIAELEWRLNLSSESRTSEGEEEEEDVQQRTLSPWR